MSSPSKIAASSSSARGQLFHAAIVGAATLKGKEVAEMLNERNFPAVDVRLLDDDESIGQLEATGDEINFIQSVRAEQFIHMDFTFFAAAAECTRQNWKRARDAGSAIIDLSGALEEEPGATVRSLWLERERGQMWQPELQPAPCIVAHPAAVALALLMLRARKAGAIRSAVAQCVDLVAHLDRGHLRIARGGLHLEGARAHYFDRWAGRLRGRRRRRVSRRSSARRRRRPPPVGRRSRPRRRYVLG